MTFATDLDTWAAGIATATGLTVTRDPAKVYPPCIYLGLPDITSATLDNVQARLPVWLVAPGAGKPAGDELLDGVLDVLDAIGDTAATPTVLAIDNTEFHAYAMTARLHFTL